MKSSFVLLPKHTPHTCSLVYSSRETQLMGETFADAVYCPVCTELVQEVNRTDVDLGKSQETSDRKSLRVLWHIKLPYEYIQKTRLETVNWKTSL